MKKRILSMILAIAMVASLFAGISLITSAATSWTVVTSVGEIVAGESYVLLVNDQTASYNGAVSSKHLQTTSGWTFVNGTATAVPDEIVTITFEAVTDVADAYYLKDSNGMYITATKAGSGGFALAESDEYGWTFANGEAGLKACYNNTAAAAGIWSYKNASFRSYAYSNANYQDGTYDIYLAKAAEIEGEVCTHANAASEVTTPAGCETDGVATWTCPDCGDTWTADIAATGHSYDDGTVTTAATCESDGEMTYTCTACAATKTEVIAAIGHSYVDGACEVCGAEKPADKVYALVTDASKLEAGKEIIFVTSVALPDGNYYGMAAYGSGNYVKAEIVAINEDGTVTISSENAICAYTLGGSENAWTIYGGGYYLYTSSTTSNHLKGEAELDANGYGTWTISITDGAATISNVANTSRGVINANYNSGSTPRFAAYSEVKTDNGFALPAIYALVEEGECIHSWGEYVQTTAPSCTEEGVETSTCTLCGETQTQAIAALGHTCESWEVTTPATCVAVGVETGVCTACGVTLTQEIPVSGHNYTAAVVENNVVVTCSVCEATETYALNTITEAKAYDSAAQTPVVYNVKGIVTYVNGRNVYIEENGDALCLYFPYGFDTSAINLGDEIFASSTMTQYAGLLELNGPTAYYVLSTGNELPANTSVTLADLLADTTNEYLGERVNIAGLTVGTVNTSGNTALTDADGNTINLYKASGLAENVTEGDTVTVTAIVSTYNGYQLLLNPGTAATDVVVTAEGEEIVITTVTIAEAKAGTVGEYYQVEGVVTFIDSNRTIYVQDETGAIALYLTAQTADACAIGDKVKGYGALKNYKGLLELDGINAADTTFFEVLSNGNTVEAQATTIEALVADTTNEYLCEKVAVNGAVITKISGSTITLKQGEGTITIYKAPTLTEDCVVGAIVNVEAIVSCYNSYQLRVVDATAVTYVSTCAHENVTVLEAVAATCTATGLTEGAQCAYCTVITVAQEVVPAQGHNLTAYEAVAATCEADGNTAYWACTNCGKYYADAEAATEVTENAWVIAAYGHEYTYTSKGDNTHNVYCENCEVETSEDCTFIDGVCTLCGGAEVSAEPTVDTNIAINHTLNLASDISITFAVKTSLLSDYDSYYLECLIPVYEGNELTGSKTIAIEPVLTGSYYYFTLTGITAVQMNDVIEATVHMSKDGAEYVSNVDTYSVAMYAYSQLNKAAATDKLKALCADLLRYGAATQTYKSYRTDALANADMTEEHIAYLSDIDAVTFGSNNVTLSDIENPSITWAGKALNLDSKVELKFIMSTASYTGNLEDLSLHVSYQDYTGAEKSVVLTEVEVYNADRSWYSFTFDGLLAAELRQVVSVAVYEGETQVSQTLQYSADTYGNNKTGALLDLCKALFAYSDTALVFFS